jgi:DNA-binding Lrp family transcriptional regulator
MDEVLHALGIKGRATPEEIATVLGATPEATLDRLYRLQNAGLVIERAAGRRPGWLLSPAGREAYATQGFHSLGHNDRVRLAEEYKAFLSVNRRAKELCAIWQSTSDIARRLDLLAELHEIYGRVEPVLARCGALAGRFARYDARLARALERAHGDPRYVVSVGVDSFHTVWFECHEDFLTTLGRSRHEESSW